MVATKEKKSFRLSADNIAYLEKYASEHGITLTEALEQVLDNARRLTDETTDKTEKPSDTWKTAKDASSMVSIPSDVLEDYRTQLAVKDEQIATLSQSLLSTQETSRELTRSLQAAQTLNAMDKEPARLEQSPEAPATEDSRQTAVRHLEDMSFTQMFRQWRNARKNRQ